MGRFSGAMIAGNDHAPVARKAGKNGKRGRTIEAIVRIGIGHILVRLRIGRYFEIAVDPEDLANRNLHVRQGGCRVSCESHCSSETSARRTWQDRWQAGLASRLGEATLGRRPRAAPRRKSAVT